MVKSQLLDKAGATDNEATEDVGDSLEHAYNELGRWANTNLWARYVKHVKMVAGIIGAVIALLILARIACCVRKRQSQRSNQGPSVTVVSMGSDPGKGGKVTEFPGIGTAIRASSRGRRKERTAQV